MEKIETIKRFWQEFFTDLLIGTFKNLFLFGFVGGFIGLAATVILKETQISPMEWNSFLEFAVIFLALIWYGTLGILHGMGSSVIYTASNKFSDAVGGLHDLLDIFTKKIIEQNPKLTKTTSKEELAQKFDSIGKDFLKQLELRGGFLRFIARIFFGVILKALKFFFLDDVIEELEKKDSDNITSADIESAVRRVGVEFIISAIKDNLLILQIINLILMLLLFGLPFGIFWLF